MRFLVWSIVKNRISHWVAKMVRIRSIVMRVFGILAASVVVLTASTGNAIGYVIDISASPSPLTGLWWNQNESGWGMTITQQYDTIFVAMYTYDSNRNPIWYVATNCPVIAGGCTSPLYRVTGGTELTVPWNPNLAVVPVGSISLVFSDNNTGTMSYTINGAPASKAITRQVFRGPVPGTQTSSFPFQTGYKALVANGLSKNFTVSGDCSGSGTKTSGPARTPTAFEGVSGFSAISTVTFSFTNCTPASIAQTSTGYYDTNFVPLGFNSVGVNYGVFLTAPILPVTVSVGGTAIIGTQNLYTNSSKTQSNGTLLLSYVVLADTASTAILNLISKSYNASGLLMFTEQSKYRIDASGTLVPISTDIQYANTSTLHIVLTYF